jgi:flavin-dependent dehydrogenase
LNKLIVKKAAVLGAGVMGAQIAAHLANANVPVVLFDLPAKDGDKNGVVKKALDGLKKLDPAPLANKGKLKFIDAANYDEHLPLACRVRSGDRSHCRAHGLEERSLCQDCAAFESRPQSSRPIPQACR